MLMFAAHRTCFRENCKYIKVPADERTTSTWNQAPRPTQPESALCEAGMSTRVNRHYRMIRGFAVFAECLAGGWLAEISTDLRRSGSTLEACSQRCAIQMAAFTLLYFMWTDDICAFATGTFCWTIFDKITIFCMM